VYLSVCLSVGHNRKPYKTDEPIKDAVRVMDSGVPMEPSVRWGPGPFQGNRYFGEGDRGSGLLESM